ncbi:MAG TPA: ATP-binding protein [Sphingomonadaceae bacterium]|nr:ATP-binding protein [Sphingomonadaceae bacterium]
MALARGGLIRRRRRGPGADELVAALPMPLLVIDPAGNVRDANGASETLFNLSRAGIVDRPIEELLGRPLDTVTIDAPFAAYDLEVVLPVNRPQRIDLHVAPMPERPGWRVATLHGRGPAHLAGRRGERGTLTAVGAAAMLAHEIRNPLSGISGAAQLLESNAGPSSRDLIRLIRGEVDRVAALIDRMEGFTDTRRLDLAPQNIHAILGYAREVAGNGFARDIRIREIYDPSLPAVQGDRDALIQIFINLIKNASEAMTNEEGDLSCKGGVITLRTAYRHGVSVRLGEEGSERRPLPIEVCVIDEGPGAPPELAEHLFDPFVTSKRRGGGLGLALVDKLVTDHGGMIEYAREGRPPHTVFRLLLPRAETEAEA